MGDTTEPRYRVLLAHSDEDVLTPVSDFLEGEGDRLSVETATGVETGMEGIRDGDFDAVVSGMSLADGTGVDLLMTVGDETEIPFVLFGGDEYPEEAREAVEAGVTEYIRTTMGEFAAGIDDPGKEFEDPLASRVEKMIDRETMRENYREVFDKANDAIFIHDPETGKILDVNERMCEMYGYTREEALELDVDDITSGDFTQEDAVREIKTAAEEGSRAFELKGRHKNGDTFWTEVSLRLASIGGRDRVLAVVRNIDERKEYERALERREERFRRIFEKHSAPMLLIEPDSGEIVDANRAASDLYGYTRDELSSMLIQEINTLPDDEVKRRRKEAELGDRDYFVFPHRKKSGEEIQVRVNSVPIDTETDEGLLFSIIQPTDDKDEGSEIELG